MAAARTLAATAAHDRGPIAGHSDLDENGAFAQALANHAQRCRGNAHVAAGALTFCFRRAVQMHAWSRVAQRAGHRIETGRPARPDESLCLHRAREGSNKESRALHRAPLHGDIKNVAAREPALSQSIVAVVADDDEAQLRTRNPRCRACADHNRKTPECRGCVDTVTLLGRHLTACDSNGDPEVLLKCTCIPRGVLSGGSNDDGAAPRRNSGSDGIRQTRAHLGTQRGHDCTRRLSGCKAVK